MISKFKQLVWAAFDKSKPSVTATCSHIAQTSESDRLTEFLISGYHNKSSHLGEEDLVFFQEFNVHCAFKYHVVKEILNDKDVFGVSTVHLNLNSLYFSRDEALHMHNKKIALKHLTFLSKEFQSSENVRVTKMFDIFLNHTPKDQPFNLVDIIVKPLLFLNSMDEFGLFESFPEFNPESPDFSFDTTVQRIIGFYADMDNLTYMLENYLEGGGKLPIRVNNLISELKVDHEFDQKEVVKFVKSMIFATVESTGSYVTSLVYEVYSRFPEVLSSSDLPLDKLQQISNEVLRIHTPVPFIFRTVTNDAEKYGKHLKTGDMVVVYLGAANMDPSVFEKPAEFRLGRSEKHLSFGRGHLACIGESASFRMGLNVIQNIRKENRFFKILDSEPQFEFENSMLKILQLNVLLHDKS
jgi:hypothetical protein